ncbi:MAG: sugar phosphate isomerase/epimerase family protein [Aurantibacter sp.]
MKTRRTFIKKTALGATAIATLPQASVANVLTSPKDSDLKLSLAQWSLHRALEKGEIKAVDFAQIANKDYGINAVEYVNQFYVDQATDEKFWGGLKIRAEDEDVKSLLIMVDNEGELGNPNETERKTAVENHYKWVDAAKILDCHSIRVNAFGKGSKRELHAALTDGLGSLAEYGEANDINVLVENHGLHTSDGKFIVSILEQVNSPFLGTLPDFGNWCLSAEWGSTQPSKNCEDMYPHEDGVADFLPFAKGVSAKTYDFDKEGDETSLDYPKLLKLVKDSGFDGYIGIEYEGQNLSEPDGIKASKALIEKTWKGLD